MKYISARAVVVNDSEESPRAESCAWKMERGHGGGARGEGGQRARMVGVRRRHLRPRGGRHQATCEGARNGRDAVV